MNRPTIPDESDPSRRTLWTVLALTMVGATLRGWQVGRLGLDHFDEGIYALAGTWAMSPGGLRDLSPTLISYAPPGFVILVGLMYALLGPSDLAAIAVSQVVGTATIPVIAWVTSRTFGQGAGVVATALVAFSGPHVAFSRVALTDSLFLIAWLIAVGCGQRFLERPSPGRAILLGLAVGLAQQCKYNGWLTGGIIAATALAGLIVRRQERLMDRWGRTFGWGLGAAAVSMLIVWPWYRFVEQHGGYGALLRHQRSYLGGFAAWGPNLRTQFEESIALSGGWPLRLTALAAAALALYLDSSPPIPTPIRHRIALGAKALMAVLMLLLFANSPWWIGLGMVPTVVFAREPAPRVLVIAWLVHSILTPFYHPYARLWLPLHALGWMFSGALIASLVRQRRSALIEALPIPTRFGVPTGGRRGFLSWWVAVAIALMMTEARVTHRARPLGGLLDPSDSLRNAVETLTTQIPDEVASIRTYARPAVAFYLGGRKAIWPQEDLQSMTGPSDPRAWGIYDSGIGTESDRWKHLPAILKERWDVVTSVPTTFSLPTLLDIDPATARSQEDAAELRQARLWLLKPRRAGGGR